MAYMLLLLAAWASPCTALLAQEVQEPKPEIRAEIDRRVLFQRNWGSKRNSPGAELRPIEIAREKVGEGVIAVYELEVKGLPSDLDYQLLKLPTMASNANEAGYDDVRIRNWDGRVVSGFSPIRLVIPDPAAGEPYRFAVVTKDFKYHAFVTILPNPIQGKDHDCEVSIIRLTRNFELAFVQLSGFPPQAEVKMRGDSEGEVHEFKLKTDAEGYADAGLMPFKLGTPRGKIAMQFTASACKPKVSFKWGTTPEGQPYE